MFLFVYEGIRRKRLFCAGVEFFLSAMIKKILQSENTSIIKQ